MKADRKKMKDLQDKTEVYQSKGRSTGLDVNDATNPTKKRRICENSPNIGAPLCKKRSPEKDSSAETTMASKSASENRNRVFPSFMGSLLGPRPVTQAKKKVLPNKPIPRPEEKFSRSKGVGGEKHPEVQRGVLDILLSPQKVKMEGLFSDTSHSLHHRSSSPRPKATSVQAMFVAEETGTEVSRRKIRFADEHGGELVQTRLIEVGERFNVHQCTPEQMRLLEEGEKSEEVTNPWLMPEQNTDTVIALPKWRVTPVESVDHPDMAYGCQSQMKDIQERRQSTSMRAFYNPYEPSSHFDEPDFLTDVEPEASDVGLRLEPIIIPIEPVPYEEEEEDIDGVPMDEEPSNLVVLPVIIPTEPPSPDSPAEPDSIEEGGAEPVINDHLKALLNGLKTKGLLHEGSEDPPLVNPYSVHPPRLQPVMIPTSSAFFQEQPHHPINRLPSSRMRPIPFPGQAPPQMAVIKSSGIQLANMDVHDAPARYLQPVRTLNDQKKPCSYYNGPRGCKNGDKCGFAHIPIGQIMNGVMCEMRGNFRRGPPREVFRGREGGFNRPFPMHGNFGTNDNRSSRDVDLRRGGSWREDRRDDRREKRISRSPPSRRNMNRYMSQREEVPKDVDLRTKEVFLPTSSIDDEDIDGVPIDEPTPLIQYPFTL